MGNILLVAIIAAAIYLIYRWWMMPVDNKPRRNPGNGRGGGVDYSVPPPFVQAAERHERYEEHPAPTFLPDTAQHTLAGNEVMHSIINGEHTWRPVKGDRIEHTTPAEETRIPVDWPIRVK